MKILKTASGKKTIKMSKREWQSIGKKAGWMKVAIIGDVPDPSWHGGPEDRGTPEPPSSQELDRYIDVVVTSKFDKELHDFFKEEALSRIDDGGDIDILLKKLAQDAPSDLAWFGANFFNTVLEAVMEEYPQAQRDFVGEDVDDRVREYLYIDEYPRAKAEYEKRMLEQ